MCGQQALDGMPRRMYLDEPTMKDLEFILDYVTGLTCLLDPKNIPARAASSAASLRRLLEAMRTLAEAEAAGEARLARAVTPDGWYTEAELARAYRELETILPEVQVEFLAKVCTQARKNRLWDSQGA